MPETLDLLERDVESVRSLWRGAPGRVGVDDGAVRDVSRLGDDELVALSDGLGRVLRDAEALMARVAGEVSRRSAAERGSEGLAKRKGFASPEALVAASTGASMSLGSRMVAVGEATRTRQALTGEVLAERHEPVAAGLAAGTLGVEASALIVRMLDRVAGRVDAEKADFVERVLVERAPELPFAGLQRLVREAQARLDEDGVAPREEEARAARSLTFRQDEHGMVRMLGVLDVETAAPIKRAVEAVVTHGIRSRRPRFMSSDGAPVEGGGADPAQTPVVADDRSIPQMQADALAMIARHMIGCGRVPTVTATTLVVRTPLTTLTDGVGHGEVDGFDAPVSAGTVRRLAASAGVIPAVLGRDSVPLDLGRTARLFSPAQRIALAERDGGCACCGLDAAYTEAHHIAWWERDTGTTDLANGVLLCPACHARIHTGGWRIQVRDRVPWFVPPPHVDPQRTPKPGGKARFRLPDIPARHDRAVASGAT